MKAHGAFTLVELLVVLGIIGLLAAILFPVLIKAKTRAYGASAISNSGQVVKAEQMYASDSDGRYSPSLNGFVDTKSGRRFSKWRTWPQLVSQYVSSVTGHGFQGCALTQDLPKIFYDPIKPLKSQRPGDTCPYSGWGISDSIAHQFAAPDGNGDFIPTTESEIAKPSDCLLIVDTVDTLGYYPDGPYPGTYIAYSVFDVWGQGVTASIDFPYPSGPRMTASVPVDPRNAAVVGFCDGHVKLEPFAAVNSGTFWSIGGDGHYP